MEELISGINRITQDENGKFSYWKNEKKIVGFYGKVILEEGEVVDTRFCTLIGMVEKNTDQEQILEFNFKSDTGYLLTEKICLETDGSLEVQCAISHVNKREVCIRSMMPLITDYPEKNSPAFIKSLWTKMLLVPYDNTMWVRYEAVPLRPGRTSYDVTAIFDENSREGLVIGAIDFNVWKNGVICSGSDARVLMACSGIADKETHDVLPHGIVKGKEVSSSRFLLLYGEDYRDLLECYGDYINKEKEIMPWDEGVPFGWNSWSGLAFRLNERNYREAGRFLREELMPEGYQNNQVTYVNLDAGWNCIGEEKLISLVEELHSNGQKAGIYLSPFAWFKKEEEEQIPGVEGHCYRDILLKDANGKVLPRVDGAVPMDVTHPLWKQYLAWQAERFLRWGFDYVKLDFLSHGGMEGVHYNPSVMTGRQAITEGYEFLAEQFSEIKAGRSFFISLSIAPLFPNGYGHARRFSCDAFGLAEDTEYVLNALTYGWWQSGRLYTYNDPDHIALYKSFCADRKSLFGEARARYTAAVIAGTVMMLSDDYGIGGEETTADETVFIKEARKRAKMISTYEEINRIAAFGKSFRPVEAAGTTACNFFTLNHQGKDYAALFHWEAEKERITFDFQRAGLPEKCLVRELWTGREYRVTDGSLIWEIDGCDAALFKIVHDK